MTTVVINLEKGTVDITTEPLVGFDEPKYTGPKVENLVHVVQTCVDQLARDAAREEKAAKVAEFLKISAWKSNSERAQGILDLIEGVDSSHGDRVDVPLQVGDPVFVPMGARYLDGQGLARYHSFFAREFGNGVVHDPEGSNGNVLLNIGGSLLDIHPDDVRRVTR